MAQLRKMMGVTNHPNPRRKLYIARPGGWRRRIPTEPAIRRMLEGYGFETIDPGTLSFAEQIEAFREARIVVGPHGAAMTNSVFMSPGGMMVELTHEKRVIVAFHEIACMTGLGYACVVGDMLETPGQPSLFSDFTVDVDQVEAAVKAATRGDGLGRNAFKLIQPCRYLITVILRLEEPRESRVARLRPMRKRIRLVHILAGSRALPLLVSVISDSRAFGPRMTGKRKWRDIPALARSLTLAFLGKA